MERMPWIYPFLNTALCAFWTLLLSILWSRWYRSKIRNGFSPVKRDALFSHTPLVPQAETRIYLTSGALAWSYTTYVSPFYLNLVFNSTTPSNNQGPGVSFSYSFPSFARQDRHRRGKSYNRDTDPSSDGNLIIRV